MGYFTTAISEQIPNAHLPPLENGDRLDQATFHERYECMGPDVHAELIGGIVYMASPQKLPHSKTTTLAGRWLDEYMENTEGTDSYAGATSILGLESEPEPDRCLVILREYGGQTMINKKGYLVGPAELMVEIADTTESRDLHQKKADYEKAGVREYVVIAIRSQAVFWFMRRGGRFVELEPDADGIFRSRFFPGLWLDAAAILRGDRKRLLKVLRAGLAAPEHQAFVKKLARRRPHNGKS